MSWLINAHQLDKFRKNQKSLIIFDASWHGPHENRDAKNEFEEKHIVDAHFFDINLFTDTIPSLPNQVILDEKIISEKLSQLGIRNDYKIIFYDNSEHHSACRALWMLKLFGHNSNQLYILDGGLTAWEKVGGKTALGSTSPSPKNYQASLQFNHLRNLDQMKKTLHESNEQVVDVRHPVRFCGGPDPRSGVRLGHFPGSFSLPYFTVFDADGLFKPLDKLRKMLSDCAISLDHPIITTCGSGMTAPIVNFVLDLLSHEKHAMYNGSWTEWAADTLYPNELSLDERPVETCLI